MPEAEQGMNVARIGVLLAGLPNTVPGMTINRFCSSGVQAVADAADRIRLGDADVMIAAGTESMSHDAAMMGNKVALNPAVFAKDENVAIAYGMGITAENVAKQWKVTREEQDAFAVRATRRPVPPSRPATSGTRSSLRLPRASAGPRHRQGRTKEGRATPTRARAPTPAWRASRSCGRSSPRAVRSPRATARRCPTAPAPSSS